ncbi:hypothetical protein RB195_015907 [Necator americanus]|uniref:Uncharacterized protein n=1 Tax=Necator americanus TaxID=51031 RepID=A0ABR1E8M6_NECAM
MLRSLFIFFFYHIKVACAALCLVADSKFGHGCVTYNSYAYNTRQYFSSYSPYSYSYSYGRSPYYYARQPYYTYRQSPSYAWQQNQYYYRGYPQQFYSSYYNPYSQPYMTSYNYGYARDHSYSYSGATRDQWGNTYVGNRNNLIWITCRTRYCSG